MMMKNGAKPCANPTCGTTGGETNGNRNRPWRARGLCRKCYLMAKYRDILDTYALVEHWTPQYFDPNDPASIGHMLWHTPDRKRKQHAVYGYYFDSDAECAEAEHDAARWLMNHVHAPLLDWPDPSLALFGAANREATAA